jgi:hypothetical protein
MIRSIRRPRQWTLARCTGGSRLQTGSFSMSLAVPHYGPWDEGMKVDGVQSRQVVHWYLQDNHYGVYFGYDLVLEPVPGSSQIKCTFSAFNNIRPWRENER